MVGTLVGMLRWEQLDALWQRVRAAPAGWYASQAGQPVPTAPMKPADLLRLLDGMDAQLRRDHAHSYCGIVYADRPEQPGFIKVYDPRHMGSFCSCSSTPPPPQWVLSRCVPQAFGQASEATGAHPPWWRRYF